VISYDEPPSFSSAEGYQKRESDRGSQARLNAFSTALNNASIPNDTS
jgi:hypothetical protein